MNRLSKTYELGKKQVAPKTLLIIGAGLPQIPAIKMAKKMGFKVVATDINPKAEGFKIADYRIVASTRDVEKSVTEIKKFNKKVKINGVMTIATEAGETVAAIAEELKLPGIPRNIAHGATDKIERHRIFKKKNIPSTKFKTAKTLSETYNACEELGYPVVFKPCDNAGSRGVVKVTNKREIKDAIDIVAKNSKSNRILIEEFITGTEHSTESVVVNGKIYTTGFSDRNYDKKEMYYPHFVEDGDTLPTSLLVKMKQKVISAAERAIEALGIDFGPAKGDIIVTKDGPKVLEMSPRLSGDYFCFETVPLHNGTNILKVVIELAMGLKPDLDALIPKFERGVALRYIFPEPGRIKTIKGVKKVRKMRGVYFFRWEPYWKGIKVGTLITPLEHHGHRVGSIMTVANNRDSAIKIAEKARRGIKIIVDQV